MNLEVEKYKGELAALRRRSEILDRMLLDRAFPLVRAHYNKEVRMDRQEENYKVLKKKYDSAVADLSDLLTKSIAQQREIDTLRAAIDDFIKRVGDSNAGV